jgi:tetratricopeptide (TPR) repeat protein
MEKYRSSGFGSYVQMMRLRTKHFSLVLLCWACMNLPSLFAQQAEERFSQANGAFLSENYPEAIRHYEGLLKGHGPSAAIFYNLGNAYFRNNEVGAAILNYERARMLAPRDPDIQANLKFVRQAVGLAEPVTPWWKTLAEGLSFNTWCVLMLVSAALIGVVTSLRIFKTQLRWNARSLIGIFAVIFLIAASAVGLRALDLNRAVILQKETPLKIAPFADSPSSFTLDPGIIVEVKNEREGFYYVGTLDRKIGWIEKTRIGMIVPSE